MSQKIVPSYNFWNLVMFTLSHLKTKLAGCGQSHPILAPIVAAVFVIGLLTVPFIYSAGTSTQNIPLFDPRQYTATELATSTLNDGIPDVWKTWYGVSVIDSTVANSDYTGSGIMNREKYRLNIYPLAPADLPPPPSQIKPKASVNKSTAAPQTPAPISHLDNWNFNDNATLGHTFRKGYKGGDFQWGDGAINGWKAVRGNQIEVWSAPARPPLSGTEQFVELNATSGSSGIEQMIKDVRPGAYILSWRHMGRETWKAYHSPYTVHVYAKIPALDIGKMAGVLRGGIDLIPPVQCHGPNDWESKILTFSVTEKILKTHANIWIAFVPTLARTTYGALIDDVRLAPLEVVQPKIKINHDELLKMDTEVGIEKYANGKDIMESVNSVRFCRWAFAFPDGSFESNFYKTDRDRFHIRVRGEIPGLSMIKISTKNFLRTVTGGNYAEKPTGDGVIEVAMQKVNGEMLSDPVLLVSDSDDDTKFNGGGTDDGKNDATLQGDFNGTIKIVFPELGNATHEVSTMKPFGRIKVNIAYCSPTGGPIPQDDRNLIVLQILKTKEAYRQIGVEIVVTNIWPYKMQDGDADKFVEEPATPGITNEVLHNKIASHRLFNNLRNAKDNTGHDIPKDQILVGFVRGILRSWEPLYDSVAGGSDGTPPIVVSLWRENAKDHFTLAHELGHIVAGVGADHLPGSPVERLMVDGLHSRYKFDHLDSKRFTVKEQEAIKARKVGGLFPGYFIPSP